MNSPRFLKKACLLFFCLLLALHCFCAGTNSLTASTTNAVSYAPATLLGNRLAQLDFFYMGKAKDERQFIARHSQIICPLPAMAGAKLEEANRKS